MLLLKLERKGSNPYHIHTSISHSVMNMHWTAHNTTMQIKLMRTRRSGLNGWAAYKVTKPSPVSCILCKCRSSSNGNTRPMAFITCSCDFSHAMDTYNTNLQKFNRYVHVTQFKGQSRRDDSLTRIDTAIHCYATLPLHCLRLWGYIQLIQTHI